MAKYIVYKDADGNLAARTERYDPKAGEKRVGTAEGANADEALDAFDAEGAEDDGSREPTAEDKEREAQQLREEEESKEEFTVMATSEGQMYVEGDEGSDPSKKSKAKAAPKPKEEKPVEVGTFRAKNAADALKMAQGKFHEPAEGAPRGAQTP
jgi:hypothetical protein